MSGLTPRARLATFRRLRARSFGAALLLFMGFGWPGALPAQSPWTVTLVPAMNPLPLGLCTAVSLTLSDPATKDYPRTPQGMRVSIADFDLKVESTNQGFAGQSSGPTAWVVCACQGSVVGTRGVITATYPAATLDEKARVKGVAFQVQAAITSAAPKGTTNSPECTAAKAAMATGAPAAVAAAAPNTAVLGGTTASAPIARVAAATPPWTVTLVPATNPLPLGFCSAVSLSLFDPATKDYPRNPQGMRVSIADFGLTVDAPDQAFIGRRNGETAWVVCACQASKVGTRGVITATYPAATLDDKARVKGVAFQVQAAVTSAAARGTDEAPECAAARATSALGTPVAAPATTRPPTAASAPTGVTVTGTPATATLAWQSVSGAVSYVVRRMQDGVPAVQQTLLSTSTGMQDVGLRPSTTYTYLVGATQADGREASVSLPFTTPAAVNPTGFTAAQTGDGQVTLTWQPVSAASYYVVFGPGSASGGVKVTGADTYTVTGVPTGLQTWTVASYYDPAPASASNVAGPGAVSTPATEFPAASVTVAAPTTGTPVSATGRKTTFDPVKHGFRFHNDFLNSFIGPPVNMTTSGLCGGMSYSALDYFNTQKTIPSQTFRPANSTTIQSYLYGRQVTSLVVNLDKWGEYSFNPLGSRTTEFFNWGLNERFTELKSFIDRGVPVPLGLRGEAGMSHDHQVLAYGYDPGRYAGNLGPHQDELKILIYDPNFPGKSMTLVPDLAAKEFRYLESTDRWRSYFVDGKYAVMPPPTIVTPVYAADGLTHELRFEFETGADDMRGGADHVDVTIRMSDNTTQFFPNVSQSGRWVPGYIETAQVVLHQPVAAASITRIEIVTNAGGGVSGDNWDMVSVQVIAVGSDTRRLLADRAGPYRFTGARIPLVIVVR